MHNLVKLWNFIWMRRYKTEKLLVITFWALFIILVCFLTWKIIHINKSTLATRIDELQILYPRYRFTYVAIIKEKQSTGYKCLGAIVDQRRIMTLAQCVLNHNNTSYEVIVGKYWLGKYEKDDEKVYDIQSVFIYPLYKSSKLLRYNYAILYTEYLPLGKSFCKTYVRRKQFPIGLAVVHGWGSFFYADEHKKPNEMQTTTFVLNKEYCKENDPVCKSELKPKFNKFCVGNFGSPIVQEKNNQQILIGFALTIGFPCNTKNETPVMLKVFEFG